jgi:uncharacterized Zn finger protein
MPSLQFFVKGSSDEPYRLALSRSNAKLSFACSCPAGTKGSICKHRLAILAGDLSAVVDGNVTAEQTLSFIAGSVLEAANKSYVELNEELDSVSKRVDAAKRRLNAAMSGK